MTDTIDTGTGIFAEIHRTLRRIEKTMAAWLQRATDEARDVRLFGSGIMPASGTENLSFPLASPIGNSPQQGRVWILRRVGIGPTLLTASAPMASGVFLVQSPSDPLNTTSPTVAEFIDTFGTAAPVAHFYSSRQVVLRDQDALWVVVLGGAASAQWVANAQVEEYSDGGYAARVEL